MDTSGRWMSLVLVLGLSVVATQAQCTDQELQSLSLCVLPYYFKFVQLIGRGSSCDRSRISNDICTDFATAVNCVNNKAVSRTTCRPYLVQHINLKLDISCKIHDFEEVCKNSPAIDTGSPPSTPTSTPTSIPTSTPTSTSTLTSTPTSTSTITRRSTSTPTSTLLYERNTHTRARITYEQHRKQSRFQALSPQSVRAKVF